MMSEPTGDVHSEWTHGGEYFDDVVPEINDWYVCLHEWLEIFNFMSNVGEGTAQGVRG